MSASQDPAFTPFPTVAFVGLGLIGGSLARLVRHQLPQTQVLALDKQEVLTQAQADGTINIALSSLEDPRLLEADLILLATHLEQSKALLQHLASLTTKPLTVMDIGSTKASICALADSLPENITFIGGHPLAGREVSGYTNSRWDLFLKKRFLLTPCQKTTPEFQHRVMNWLSQLGTDPVLVDQYAHDELMSLVSHFPQFYAIALANLIQQNNPDESMHFLGGGIDDQMRLMASPYGMWRDVFQDNKENLNDILTQFIGILTEMQQALTEDRLDTWFEKSQEIYALYQQNKRQTEANAIK